MSEADKMFKKLGYRLEEEHNKHCDMYCYVLDLPNFHKKEIRLVNNCNKYIHLIFWEGKTEYALCVNMQELKAINQKCKELGWLE